ncbi:hypothetical protein D3C78_1419730 [compost metagenome]
MQAGPDQRRLAGAARAGEQHVVGRAALHELLGIARDLFLLPIDVLQIGQLHRADMPHGLEQPAAIGPLAVAPGNGFAPVLGRLQRLGQHGLDALHQLLGTRHQALKRVGIRRQGHDKALVSRSLSRAPFGAALRICNRR